MQLASPNALLHLAPALALALLLALVLRRARSPYALPALLLAVPAAFHLALLVAGVSLEEARAGGWVTPAQVRREPAGGSTAPACARLRPPLAFTTRAVPGPVDPLLLQPADGEWKFWCAWDLYNLHDFPPSNIRFAALVPQAGKLAALFFVVAFGSSMDIAGAQGGRRSCSCSAAGIQHCSRIHPTSRIIPPSSSSCILCTQPSRQRPLATSHMMLSS